MIHYLWHSKHQKLMEKSCYFIFNSVIVKFGHLTKRELIPLAQSYWNFLKLQSLRELLLCQHWTNTKACSDVSVCRSGRQFCVELVSYPRMAIRGGKSRMCPIRTSAINLPLPSTLITRLTSLTEQQNLNPSIFQLPTP